ncbi:TonB-dependent receptor [Shewanella sp. 1_MG-2023]|uniref:TonB-dependent receptor n=1 Tax=Shewanella electrodiphila TaxID=934143 RepID=A0ABT0KTX2_9GAMM|nr:MULTISPECIES: TonB-dependent receptor [Shewanella]MCC4833261.1 TonB-dependent receptor [Shewanella sp. 10N.7]MCL1047213.1 TonB-dependent receptor [Shewanella electrodiphila]MDO6612756.1 TonB-dependent receptor [Shewanella sp. 7_MG-2023]MDO6772717.1 TonB-dependent receptor [Shewanella sp. 2_MG-2023]MDO6794881.1 TonB-dependent receptor [Shewanella sp. 1_MG-2023]
MKKIWLAITFSISLVAFSQQAQANTTEEGQQYTPSVALLVDYVDSRGDMFGVTIAAKHFDPDYADWGYYIGYAWGDKYDLDVPEPGEGYAKEYMWRFGLSYSLTQDLSVYGGATAYIYEENTTDNIVPFIVGGEPVWERSRNKEWGAEFGVRYNVTKGFVIGAGYDTSADAAIFSIGVTM